MDRREWLTLMGAAGAALVPADADAQDHGGGKAKDADSPLSAAHAHFCGIHVAKMNPKLQFITQHYCTAHSGGHDDDAIYQCLLYDSVKPTAKLLGVEYIISNDRYKKLPDAEKKFWHPHSYEVLGGGLIAPAMTPDEERAFMKGLLTTWGKTWHTWPDPTTDVPMGVPMLIWSLTGDGQVDPNLLATRDREFKVSTEDVGARRRKEIGYQLPHVSPPKSVDQIGRMWTDEGDDTPTPLK